MTPSYYDTFNCSHAIIKAYENYGRRCSGPNYSIKKEDYLGIFSQWLTALKPIKNLSLTISSCHIKVLPNLSKLRGLKRLTLHCDKLQKIEGLAQLRITHLGVETKSKTLKLDGFDQITTLHRATIINSHCANPQNANLLGNFEMLHGLSFLDLRGCNLVPVEFKKQYTTKIAVRKLNKNLLSSCSKAESLQKPPSHFSFKDVTSITAQILHYLQERLNSDLHKPEEILSFPTYTERNYNSQYSSWLEKIRSSKVFESLQQVRKIGNTYTVTCPLRLDLTDIQCVPLLEKIPIKGLELCNGNVLKSISFIEKLPLVHLVIKNCQISDFSPLCCLDESLKSFYIEKCPNAPRSLQFECIQYLDPETPSPYHPLSSEVYSLLENLNIYYSYLDEERIDLCCYDFRRCSFDAYIKKHKINTENIKYLNLGHSLFGNNILKFPLFRNFPRLEFFSIYSGDILPEELENTTYTTTDTHRFLQELHSWTISKQRIVTRLERIHECRRELRSLWKYYSPFKTIETLQEELHYLEYELVAARNTFQDVQNSLHIL